MVKSKTSRARSSRVFTMHGVVSGFKPDSCAHHGLFEASQFVEHLRSRNAPYVDLNSALAGRGDALTIDDATRAGCVAAQLAREHGHEVTLFINPGNVANAQPYYFILLNLAVDRTKLGEVSFSNQRFDLRTFANKRLFREQMKQKFLHIADEEERLKFIRQVATLLQVADLSVPDSFQTVDVADLRKLQEAGVTIGNHGWTHAPLCALSTTQVKEEIVQGRTWIKRELGCDASAYAVPFGCFLPPFSPRPDVYSLWLLSSDLLSPGFVGPAIYNRDNLRLE